MSEAKPSGGKKALSAYFSKGRAKKAEPEEATAGGVATPAPAAPAPAPAAPAPASHANAHTSASASTAGLSAGGSTATADSVLGGAAQSALPVALSSASSSGWVEEEEAPQHGQALTQLRGRVHDITDEEFAILSGEAAPAADIEADEAKDAFWNARLGAAKRAKAKAAGIAPAPAPAPAPAASFLSRLEARKAGTSLASGPSSSSSSSALRKGAVLDTNNATAFPTLAAAASGLPPGAKFAPEPTSDLSKFASKGAWSVFAADVEEDGEGEAAAEGDADAKPADASVSTRATASGVAATAPAPIRAGVGEELTSDEEVSAAVQKIWKELRESSDVVGALNSICDLRVDDISRRARVASQLVQAGLDAERDSERSLINNVLRGLPAHGAAPTHMLAAAVETFLDPDVFADLSVDYPRLATYLSVLLRGCVDYGAGAGGGYVAFAKMPPALAKLLPPPEGVKVVAASTAAPSPSPAPAASPAPAPAPASGPEPAAPAAADAAPAATEASAVADEDVDQLFAGKKKKKGGK